MLVVLDPSVRAQPLASITLPAPGSTKQLYPGCNAIALTFPDGTASQTVLQAVTPPGAVQAMWRHNAALNKFEGFSSAAPQASDLLTVNFLDPVWLCLAGAPAPVPTEETPPPPPPPPSVPTAAPTTAPSPTTLVFTGQNDKDTPSFEVLYAPFSISWITQSSSAYAWFSLVVYPEGTTNGIVCQADFDGAGSDSTVCHAPVGRYWISVIAANLDSWRIQIGPPPPTTSLPATFMGQGNKDTSTFHVDAQVFTITWTTQSSSAYAWLAIVVYREGATNEIVCQAEFDGVGNDSMVCHADAGDYYAVVLAANLDSWRLDISQ